MGYWKNGKADVKKTRNREGKKVAIERNIVRKKERQITAIKWTDIRQEEK